MGNLRVKVCLCSRTRQKWGTGASMGVTGVWRHTLGIAQGKARTLPSSWV